MKSLEWMPLFGDDFWESERVAAMDDSAALLYSWLLWRQFKHGDLPPADSLRRLPHRWPGKEFDRLWPQVKACFDVLDDGRLSNPRCAEERSKMLSRVEAARIKGSSGGRARAAARSSTGIAPATAQAEPRHSHSSSTGQAQTGPDRDQDRTGVSPPTPLRGKSARAPTDWRAILQETPELNTPEVVAALERWTTYRRKRRLGPWVDDTWRELLQEAVGWGAEGLIAAVTHTIKMGWQGLQQAPPVNGEGNGHVVSGRRNGQAQGANSNGGRREDGTRAGEYHEPRVFPRTA